MTTNPRLRGGAGLTPLPAQGAGRHPSVPLSCWGPEVLVPAREQRAAEPDQPNRAGTGETEDVPSACPASPQPASKEGRDRTTCEGGAGLPSSKLFPGEPLSWGTASRRCQSPAPLPGAAAGAARGAGPGPLGQHLQWDRERTGGPASVQEAVPSQRARPAGGPGRA